MTTLHHYYNEPDEFESSLSISVVLIVLSLIISLGYMYSPDVRRNSAEASLQENFNTIEFESPSHLYTYPEPGSLAY